MSFLPRAYSPPYPTPPTPPPPLSPEIFKKKNSPGTIKLLYKHRDRVSHETMRAFLILRNLRFAITEYTNVGERLHLSLLITELNRD